ncbi:hypothetical protein [Halobaculum sp. P14]|uniref:hypothetical protein n=1 Tax=Halobaculum sp. P14 TaxID=3421638 RepID=UPI003EBAD58C
MSKTTEPADTGSHLKDDLAWTIAEHRTPTEAAAMTEHIMSLDEGQHELLGVADGCDYAVFWDHIWRGTVRVSFDADGADDPVDVNTQRDGRFGLGEYLRGENLAEWDWVHPRHAWRM